MQIMVPTAVRLSNLSGTVEDLDESPDSPDANWCVSTPLTVLATAAASLSAGQSVKLSTSLPASTLIYSSENADMIQWGGSAYYDPTRKEVGFIGKRDSSEYPYHWLVYNETANTWSNSRAVWSSANTSGHGYDHNTIDPATGTVYHRPYGSKTVQVYNGSWSTLPAWTPNTAIIGGLSWFPGVGLIYNDGAYLLRYSGGSWTTLASYGGDDYVQFSEYNSTANVLIFGGGSSGVYRKMDSSLNLSTIASPSFTLGVGSGHGLCVSDPSSGTLIAYQRASPYAWAKYTIATDTWASLTESTGDGSSPQTGTPNMPNDTNASIAAEIPAYGVVMFIKYNGPGSDGEVWLYKHS